VIVVSIASILAVLVTRQYDIAWPWFAPIETFISLLFGMITSAFWGEVSAKQQPFYQQQKTLFETPTAAHYGLLLFAALSILACAILPNWLHNALSE
jgi:SSS family solute:Na+ symporter